MALLGTVIGRGVVGSRPAAGTAGAMYYGTDTLRWYRDNGSSWDDASGNPMTTSGDLIYGGSSGLETRLAVGATNQMLGVASGVPAWSYACIPLFVATASVTLNSSNVETSILGTGVGSLTLPANFLTVGRTLRLTVRGYFGTKALSPGTVTVKSKLGSTVIGQTTAVGVGSSIAARYLEISALITCRTTGATGSVIGQGGWYYQNGASLANLAGGEMTNTSGAITIDTTGTLAVDVTWTWSTSDSNNTVTTTNVLLEALY